MTSQQSAWKRYYNKNKDRLNAEKAAYHKKRYTIKSMDIKEKTAKRRELLKREVMSFYGKNGEAACVICGFSDIDGLCLDHIENNGSRDRKSNMGKNVGGSGSRFYSFLRTNRFPIGYQTLCANHNLIKEVQRKRTMRGY